MTFYTTHGRWLVCEKIGIFPGAFCQGASVTATDGRAWQRILIKSLRSRGWANANEHPECQDLSYEALIEDGTPTVARPVDGDFEFAQPFEL